jgi:hypothetical protein
MLNHVRFFVNVCLHTAIVCDVIARGSAMQRRGFHSHSLSLPFLHCFVT